ncbi:hypothetical protein [Microbacterium paludicola]|uniref:hypothetical protein n=1 Tax=Microbacterium paludicola TaxID=300019 RepID=UPI0031E4092C
MPLYPFGFGTALGRSFSVLRGNPRVLLGFAVGVQAAASFVGLLILGGVSFLMFSRLATVEEFSDEFDALMAGSIAVTAVVGVIVTLALSALNVVVQGVVVAEVSRATVGERATLRELWAIVRPSFWRLVGYFVLQLLAILVVALVVAVPVIIGAGTEQYLLAALIFPLLLAMIPLWAWIGTKLYLVPSAIVLEGIGPIAGIRRSWQLTRGRFWPTFGVMVLISVIVSVASSIVTAPLQLFGSFLPVIVMPFGEGTPEPGDFGAALATMLVVTIVTMALQLLVSAIGTIVTGAGGALMYIDARMRREGLDLRLQSYVEQRELGASELPDPWPYDPAYAAYAAQPRYGAPGPAQPGYAQQPGYPQQPPQGYPQQPGYPQQQQQYPGHPGQPPYPAPPSAPAAEQHPQWQPPQWQPPAPPSGGA